MKTPEEIKNSLIVCTSTRILCDKCLYNGDRGGKCVQLMADALAYINQLENYIRATNPAPTWISMADRMPGIGVRVLALDTMGYICDGELTDKSINGLVFCSNWSVGPIDKITHWMPLPEPPKEELK